MKEILEWRARWALSGFKSIPLKPGTKEPFCRNWNVRDSDSQWREASEARVGDLNIGVLPGEGHVITDTDDERATKNIRDWLSGLGLPSVPRIATATPGHERVVLQVADIPHSVGDVRNLRPDVGNGSLRFHGANCVVPNSIVNGRRYEFITGAPEDIATLPVISWRDVAWLVAPPKASPRKETSAVSGLPIRLVYRELKPYLLTQLTLLKTAPKGERMAKVLPTGELIPAYFASRSEAEAYVVTALILHGWSLGQVQELFDHYLPGHYAESDAPEDYLRRTYEEAVSMLVANPERQVILDAYQRILCAPWPGRNGPTDRDVLAGLLAISWQNASAEVFASVRDISEYAAVNPGTVSKSLKRLRNACLVQLVDREVEDGHAHKYVVNLKQLRGIKATQLTGAPVSCVALMLSGDCSELWAHNALGKTAGLLYANLDDAPRTVQELQELTGKCKRAVENNLEKLEREKLARRTESGWVRGDVSLEVVAQRWDATGRMQTRRLRHRREREVFQRRLRETKALGERIEEDAQG